MQSFSLQRSKGSDVQRSVLFLMAWYGSAIVIYPSDKCLYFILFFFLFHLLLPCNLNIRSLYYDIPVLVEKKFSLYKGLFCMVHIRDVHHFIIYDHYLSQYRWLYWSLRCSFMSRWSVRVIWIQCAGKWSKISGVFLIPFLLLEVWLRQIPGMVRRQVIKDHNFCLTGIQAGGWYAVRAVPDGF